ncbi:phage integrase N-terminal domain-containing protein, partial [Escherichia coli]
VRHIKTHHVELYIRSRLAESISKRTLQNEMAALRAIFNVAGRSKLADPAHECLSNSALGLSGASRDGTKVAISDERYQAVFSVIKIKDEG